MRGSLIGLVVALLAVPVYGQISAYSATISIETPGSAFVAGGGCQGQDANVIDCDALELNGSGNWYLDIVVSCSDTSGMSAFGITLGSDCGDICYLDMEEMMGNILNYCGAYSGYASRPGMPNNGWSQADGIRVMAGCLPMAGPPDDTVGTIYGTAPATDGLAAWLEMTPLTCPVCCCIGACPPDTGAYVGDSGYERCEVGYGNLTVIPLCITPEPASALLLLVGLPLLRRRR